MDKLLQYQDVIPRSHWHGKRTYCGLHYDLHARLEDTVLGTRCDERELVPMLKLMGADWVQTDCKGHPGYLSWFSKVPGAAIPPKLKQDALKKWRDATRKLGLPLHCHYSGIWDKAAGERHHDWCVVPAPGHKGKRAYEKMCPRSPYLDKLMIPQMIELIDRYDVDGFWIDGDLWAVEPCYCRRCRRAFTAQTGIASPPTAVTDADWPRWWSFTLDSFNEYVTRYCDAVHRHKPGVLVCSNWLQSFVNPGAPAVPTDWISGDNVWVYGMDGSRCEARWLSARGKHWDIMLWNFYNSHGLGRTDSPWTVKPPQMLMQEAAVLLALGGNVQIYESPVVRDGRLIPWRQKRMAAVVRFIKQRRRLCQGGATIPQVAVLHSEHHIRATTRGQTLMWDVDTGAVRGAVFAMLENHFGVDILDEWALRPRLNEFPVVIAPECHAMSDEMVADLKQYVRDGGKLVVTGAALMDRFGSAFLGVTRGRIVEKETYHVPVADGSVPVYSASWRLVKPTTAKVWAWLHQTPLLDDQRLPHPAVAVNRVGKGTVLYIPGAICRDFHHNRYSLTRAFLGEIVRRLAGSMDIEVRGPHCVDVAMRRQGTKTVVHLINRASGIPNQPNNGVIDEIPQVGPVTVSIALPKRPTRVRLAFERADIKWKYRRSRLTVQVPHVHIHAALVVELRSAGAAS